MGYVLGVEFGSTRIKATLTDDRCRTVKTGGFSWENKFEEGYFTYGRDEIWQGLKESVEALLDSLDFVPDIKKIGISGMMHGYLVLGEDMEPLIPFRTWRNTCTGKASRLLSEAFDFNIPQRWSISHLYRAIDEKEPHVKDIRLLTTLSGYVHYHLTGSVAIGMNEASGMFPFDKNARTYDKRRVDIFDSMVKDADLPYTLLDILPTVYEAGAVAGMLTEKGALLLDGKGRIKAGALLCPPEGDSATGMISTNSIRPGSGNVSAGTSVFATVVLSDDPIGYSPEVDVASTPDGFPVAMVQCNNCTSEINAFSSVIKEALALFGKDISEGELMTALFEHTENADPVCGGVYSCNYLSGEHLTGFEEGRPLLVHHPKGRLTLANLMRSEIYSSLTSLAIGARLLRESGAELSELVGQGGFFKTPHIAARAMSAALGARITLLDNASEGGSWGIAVLASYIGSEIPLSEYLKQVFDGCSSVSFEASEAEREDFALYLEEYERLLKVERAAVDNIGFIY